MLQARFMFFSEFFVLFMQFAACIM